MQKRALSAELFAKKSGSKTQSPPQCRRTRTRYRNGQAARVGVSRRQHTLTRFNIIYSPQNAIANHLSGVPTSKHTASNTEFPSQSSALRHLFCIRPPLTCTNGQKGAAMQRSHNTGLKMRRPEGRRTILHMKTGAPQGADSRRSSR